MTNALPKTKLDEVLDLVIHSGLKDVRTFGSHASKRLAFRQSLSQLLERNCDIDDRTSAHMSLAIIANYENKHQDALHHFQRAYELAPSNGAIISNYARALGTAGQPELAAKKFLEAFYLMPSDTSIFMPLVRICVDYLYTDILTDALKIGQNLLAANFLSFALEKINEAGKTLNFLKQHRVSLDVYRSVFQCVEFLIYSMISIGTPVDDHSFINIDSDYYSNMIRIAHLNPVQIADMNDALEDRILTWVDENKANYPDGELKRMVSHLVFYFMPMDDIEVAHAS